MVRYLRLGIRLLALLALLVAFGVWVSGPGEVATRFRTFVVRWPREAGSRLNAGPVGPFVDRYATALRVLVIAVLGVILLLFDSPSLVTVIVLAVICVILLLIIEIVASVGPSRPSGGGAGRRRIVARGHDRCPRARGEGLRES